MDDPNLNLDLFGQSVAEDSEDDVQQDHQEEEGNESGPGVRGKYIGREMIKMRSDGKKKEVEYNSWGQAISDGANKLHSEIGKYVRHHVTLLVDDWRLISKEVKDKLWNEMLSMFITGTKTKSYVLSVGGDRWREFKSYLTNFIYTHKDDNPQLLDKPPKLYENVIDPEEWKAFVDYRLSEEWLVKRKSAQSSRKQNKYNHRTGRGGVRKVREKMEKELGHQIDDVDRADLWINMYKNKKGEFDVETQKVVDKINDLKKQVEEGTLVLEGSKDILTLALGTNEHGGRVRGMGRNFTQTQYFKTPRPTKKIQSTIDDNRMTEVEKRLQETDEMYRQTQQQLKELLQQLNTQHSNVVGTSHASGSGIGGASNEQVNISLQSVSAQPRVPPPNVFARPVAPPLSVSNLPSVPLPPNVSAPPTPPPDTTMSEKKAKCSMYLVTKQPKNSTKCVAKGYLVIENVTTLELHNEKFDPKRFCRVFIEEVFYENARLPCPVTQESLTTVGEVVNSYVAWPIPLVKIDGVHQTQEKGKKRDYDSNMVGPPTQPLKHPRRPDKLPISRYTPPEKSVTLSLLEMMVEQWPKEKNVLEVDIGEDVFGVEHKTYLSKNDILDICNLKWIGSVPMSVWCRYES
ncbi:uncharacterized protein LOC133039297 [Cannabis sativa]|uniref:uncharacterized protein LOC133039297 n=1 Tax=Cannabis sativa TaxID=3483 RepID=UPI0029CA5D5D|nr:uncharacterized protein LOC133039297 [Cannabis sativa]